MQCCFVILVVSLLLLLREISEPVEAAAAAKGHAAMTSLEEERFETTTKRASSGTTSGATNPATKNDTYKNWNCSNNTAVVVATSMVWVVRVAYPQSRDCSWVRRRPHNNKQQRLKEQAIRERQESVYKGGLRTPDWFSASVGEWRVK